MQKVMRNQTGKIINFSEVDPDKSKHISPAMRL